MLLTDFVWFVTFVLLVCKKLVFFLKKKNLVCVM